jgi:hypothetical protein
VVDGFLAEGTGNDPYALGYYLRDDLPVHAHLADRFTVHDRSFASLCAGTFPNRQYAYTAQSNGDREDPGPLKPGMYDTPTIFSKLRSANVPFRTHFSDIPMLSLWGQDYKPFVRPIDSYFEDCAAGTLPNVIAVTSATTPTSRSVPTAPSARPGSPPPARPCPWVSTPIRSWCTRS